VQLRRTINALQLGTRRVTTSRSYALSPQRPDRCDSAMRLRRSLSRLLAKGPIRRLSLIQPPRLGPFPFREFPRLPGPPGLPPLRLSAGKLERLHGGCTRKQKFRRSRARDPLSRVSRLASRRPYLTARPIPLIIRASSVMHAAKSLRNAPRVHGAEFFVADIARHRVSWNLVSAKADSVIPHKHASACSHIHIDVQEDAAQ